MKKLFIAFACVSLLASCNNSQQQTQQTKTPKAEIKKPQFVGVRQISEQEFSEHIFDFAKSNNQWKFRGERLCIVDIYASWCGPCKRIAPFFDSLAMLYKGKVDFYKIDIDKAPNLSQFFGIRSIPLVMFCTKDQLYLDQGAKPFEFYQINIDSLLVK